MKGREREEDIVGRDKMLNWLELKELLDVEGDGTDFIAVVVMEGT